MAPPSTEGFPLPTIVSGMLSFLQWAFANPDIIPPEYRWDSDDRASKIRISGPFVIDNEKPMSAPYIVVERGSFNFSNSTIDNLKSQDPVTGEESEKVDWMDGSLNITFGSGTATEASNLANIVAIILQSNRHGIASTLKFVRRLQYVGIGPEIPIVKYAEVHRWETTLQMSVSLQFGWIVRQTELEEWNSVDIINTDEGTGYDTGETTQGSDLLVDTSRDFGVLSTNDPQLLSAELSKGWYYIRFDDNPNDQLYVIKEIVDNNTLRLATHDANDDETPWIADETSSGLGYKLFWNHVHVHVKIPSASS